MLLAKTGKGVYAGPLRMLAQEAHERLGFLVGENNVGLVTGEERINPSAPIICSTAEMAPLSANLLILDEIQWAADPERGYAWTRVLAAGTYNHLRILGAVDAKPLVLAAHPDAEITERGRLGSLEWCGEQNIFQLRPNTVVIAFSRKAVLYLAQELKGIYGEERVATLYGAMPVGARRKEIQRVFTGAADLVVATDVLGHGVNLPCKTVLFAETNKFDGQQRRDLRAWEAAQIAGRAGRYGLAGDGEAGVLTGMDWFSATSRVVRAGLKPPPHRVVKYARLRPQLTDVICDDNHRIVHALDSWAKKAKQYLSNHAWLVIEPVEPIQRRIQFVRAALGGKSFNVLSVQQLWVLANSPIDVDNEDDAQVLGILTRSLVDENSPYKNLLPGSAAIHQMSLSGAESIARRAQALRWASYALPELSVSQAWASEAENAAASRVSHLLKTKKGAGNLGHCEECGTDVAPWYTKCYRCAFPRDYRYYDYEEDRDYGY